MKSFRKWSEETSISAYKSLFGTEDADVKEAFKENPYSWLWLLIPICGIVAFYAEVWQVNMDRRRANLERRKREFYK